MKTVNIHEAKTHFSRLIDEVSNGEEIIVARAGKPAARIVPMQRIKPVRRFGALRGQIRISGDFNAPLPDALIKLFEGS